MSSRRSIVARVVSLLGAFALFTPGVRAESAGEPPEAVMKNILDATLKRDYQGFLRDANDKLAGAITKRMFEAVSNQINPRLQGGYRSHYLGKLNKGGHAVYLWRLEFTDRKDDALFTLSMKDGKAGGVHLQ